MNSFCKFKFALIGVLIISALNVYSNSSPVLTDCFPDEFEPEQLYSIDRESGNKIAAYYLYPYNLHLTDGATSDVPLTIVDENGSPVPGTMSFWGFNSSLISIDVDGYVTALREETPTEIGTWVHAAIDGQYASNQCIVRVLSADYDLDYVEEVGDNTVLYYPDSIQGEDIAGYVEQFQIHIVDEYSYLIQQELMGVQPFNGARQILELDFGETEQQRVCGISGNPLRLGWNILGNVWQNCFLVPFIPPRSPQWFIFYHEMGHNFTFASYTFSGCFGSVFSYSEGLASAIALENMDIILSNSADYPLDVDAYNSLEWVLNNNSNIYTGNFESWLAGGAVFGDIDPDIVDGIWLTYKDISDSTFGERFFAPLKPEYQSDMSPIVDSINTYGSNAAHTFFAALVSAAARQDLSSTFAGSYNYPIIQSFFDYSYILLMDLLPGFICGDVDGNEAVNILDITYLIAYLYKEGPAPDLLDAADVNTTGTVNILDITYLIAFLYKDGPEPDCP